MNTFPHPTVFAYVETTIPIGMTLSDYRRSLPRRAPGRLARLRLRAYPSAREKR